jgi:hypothetical protein
MLLPNRPLLSVETLDVRHLPPLRRPTGHHGRTGASTVTVAKLLGRQPVPGIEHHRAEPAGRRPGQLPRLAAAARSPRALILGVLLALTIGGLTALGLAVHPANVYAARAEPPRLALTTTQVHADGAYFATATGFLPGEPVQFSWTGPTNGVMGPAAAADQQGRAVHGPIIEKDPSGVYQIVATGLTSKHTATAPLRVLDQR